MPKSTFLKTSVFTIRLGILYILYLSHVACKNKIWLIWLLNDKIYSCKP